ncbi:MAG: hypothetical protein JNJ55_09920 [Betaproteobacteria bacterium]|nr:hypothetical protein [Betaproteobacteria bacterium]
MKRILFSWEMGSGLGHLGRFQPLHAALVARGATCAMALRELANVHSVFGSNAKDVWQVPVPRPVQQHGSIHVGYADSLRRVGYGDAAVLEMMLNAWLRIIDAVRPDMLIADYAPTALLAARVAGVPVATFGCTFARPPAENPLPVYRWWQAGNDGAAIQSIENLVATTCNTVLKRHAAQPIDNLAALLDSRFDWLTTVRELDHYGSREHGEFVGPMSGLKSGDAPRWPIGLGPRVFVYLRQHAELTQQVLSHLVKRGARTLIYSPNGETQEQPGVIVSNRLIDLAKVCEEADFAISHTGIIAESFLLAGKPVLMFPVTIEQHLRARRIAETGGGLLATVRSTGGSTVADETLDALFEKKSLVSAAQAMASRYRSDHQIEALQRIANQIISG